jgi:hypothetical protein
MEGCGDGGMGRLTDMSGWARVRCELLKRSAPYGGG